MDEYLKGACQHCRGRIEFPANAAGAATACPHCGRQTLLIPGLPETDAPEAGPSPEELLKGIPQTPSPYRKTAVKLAVVAGVLLALLALLLAAAALLPKLKSRLPSAGARAGSPVVPSPKETKELTVVSFAVERQPGSSLIYVTGLATNPTPRPKFSVRVEFEVLDARGQPLGKATDYTPALESGKGWAFKALAPQKEAAQARLAGIHGQD